MSVRELARRSEVSPAYVSRLARRQKAPSGEVAARIALAMGLPGDYFPETRVQLISERLDGDPVLRDRIYDIIFRQGALTSRRDSEGSSSLTPWL